MRINKKFIILSVILMLICSTTSSLITFQICKYSSNNNYYDENVLKVVEVESYDDTENKSYGSGWFLDDTTVVTNYHVISYLISGERESFETINIRFYDSEEYEKVSLMKFDEAKDIAFLQYNGNHKHSTFKTQSHIYTSEKCYNIGNFSNYGLSYKEGYISLVCIELNYNNHSSFFIQCQLSIGQGDSGSPIFNENNEVIGMVTFRTKGLTGNVEQGFAYAIPVNYIVEEYKKKITNH